MCLATGFFEKPRCSVLCFLTALKPVENYIMPIAQPDKIGSEEFSGFWMLKSRRTSYLWVFAF